MELVVPGRQTMCIQVSTFNKTIQVSAFNKTLQVYQYASNDLFIVECVAVSLFLYFLKQIYGVGTKLSVGKKFL